MTTPSCGRRARHRRLTGRSAHRRVRQQAINDAGANGLIHGNPALVGIQIIAIVVTIVYSFGLSFVILKVLDRTMACAWMTNPTDRP